MKKTIIAVILALALTAVVLPVAAFADTGSVDCTVSAGTVGVTVSPTSVSYGTLPLDAVKNTAQYDATNNTAGMSTPQTVTIETSGGVAVDMSIQSSNALGSTDWTLGASRGDETFTHAYNVSDTLYDGTSGITFTQWSAAGADVEIASNVTNVTKYLELELGMPNATIDIGEHTITVTVTAVQHEG